MPRARRIDYPGAWFHIMNRGSARRTIFENRSDSRYFLALLAHGVRRGDIEVHAYCLMATHYHLLVRSVTARLASVMQWIQDLYARWFNRKRRRDGPLFRGRYKAKLIPGLHYRTTVFHYIHRNPVQAGLVPTARAYPYSSAKLYARPRGPCWLSRTFGDRLGELASRPPFMGKRVRELSERWMNGRGEPRDLEDLLGAAPRRVQQWMERKQRLADGLVQRVVLVHPETVRELIACHRNLDPGASVKLTRRRQGSWDVLEAGALRCWSGLTMLEVARLQGTSTSTASSRVRTHATALADSEEYRGTAARVLAEAIGRDHQAKGEERGTSYGNR